MLTLLLQDDSAVIPLPSSMYETLKIHEAELEEDKEYWSQEYMDSFSVLSEYKSDVLVYIAGYIQRTLAKNEDCIDCKLFLTNMKIVESSKLLNIKNQGPLCIPSVEVVKIVKVAHSLVEKRLGEPDLLTERNIVEKLAVKTVCIVQSLYPNLLKSLLDHADSCSITNNHKIKVIKKITSFYITTVFHHFCRQHNNKDAKFRNLYSKLILFKNQ
jgi:hypothetical protein